MRRLSATLSRGGFTLDVGKQFIRWGKADILNPTDRFAPRDFLNVVDSEFLAVTGVRASVESHGETVDAVWLPRLTPSRIPLLDQRWSAVPLVPPAVLRGAVVAAAALALAAGVAHAAVVGHALFPSAAPGWWGDGAWFTGSDRPPCRQPRARPRPPPPRPGR